MKDVGLTSNIHTISFDCTLPAGVDWVWWHLTDPQGLRAWLADGHIEPRLGGAVRLRFQRDETLVKSNCGVTVRGVISGYEERRRLAFTWLDAFRDGTLAGSARAVGVCSHVTFHLTGGHGRTLLSLTHTGLSARELSNVGTGWHAHLGLLTQVLSEDADGGIAAQHAAFARRGSYFESSVPGMRA